MILPNFYSNSDVPEGMTSDLPQPPQNFLEVKSVTSQSNSAVRELDDTLDEFERNEAEIERNEGESKSSYEDQL